MSSTATAHRRLAARPGSGALLDAAVAVAALAGSLALLRHGGTVPSRHAPELDLTGAVELRVTNPVPARGAPRSGGGHGLVGMRERATLLGGSLDVERPNGAFRVRTRLPYGGRRA